MKKIFSLFAAVLFAGSMMAADAKYTINFSTNGEVGENVWKLPFAAYNTAAASYTYDGKTISFNASASKGHKIQYQAVKKDDVYTGDTIWKPLIFGQKDATLTLPTLDFAVNKIIVYGAAGASGKITFDLLAGETKVGNATSSAVDHEFDIPAASQAAGTVYSIKVTNANNCQISKIEFYEAVAGAPAIPTFSVAEGIYTEAQTVALACETEGAKIYYTLDGTDPTAASTAYTAALNIAATTTVKAIAVKNELNSPIASATYKIVALDGDGSETNPYSVADVINLENSRPAAAWVKGYILGAMNSNSSVLDNSIASNIALGATADAAVENAIPVQLTASSAPRTALNVVDNASNIGQLVLVHGTLEQYCGKPGVKGTDDYKMEATAIDNTEVEAKAIKTFENGQLVIIKNGVKYNATGAIVK